MAQDNQILAFWGSVGPYAAKAEELWKQFPTHAAVHTRDGKLSDIITNTAYLLTLLNLSPEYREEPFRYLMGSHSLDADIMNKQRHDLLDTVTSIILARYEDRNDLTATQNDEITVLCKSARSMLQELIARHKYNEFMR